MASGSRHLSVVVAADPRHVYAFAAEPANLRRWAAGLGDAVEQDDGRLVVDGPLGRVTVRFAPPNAFGVLDHDVALPSGATVHNPLRVLAHPDGAEVVFSLRRLDGMSDDEFERDAATVVADLERLRALLTRSA